MTSPDAGPLDLAEDRRGTRVRLRVKAGGRTNALCGIHAGALRVTVTAPPDKGKANRAVLALLAGTLGIAPSALELVSGHASPLKTVRVPLAAAEVRSRLAGPPRDAPER